MPESSPVPPSLDTWLVLALAEPAPSALLEALSQRGLSVVQVTTGLELDAALSDRMVAVVLADVKLPAVPFDTVRPRMAKLAPRASLVAIADPASIAAAIDAVKGGAHDYVLKPLVVDEVLFVVEGACAAANARPNQPAWA